MPEFFVDNFFVRKKVPSATFYCPLHYHETSELYYLLSGNMTYFINDETYYLSKGDIIIAPKGSIHSTNSNSPGIIERSIINFNSEHYFADAEPQLNFLHNKKIINIPEDKRAVIDDMFFKIEYEYRGSGKFKSVMLKAYLTELIIYLCRYSIPVEALAQPTGSLMRSIAEYISENYNQDISLSVLGKKFNLSESYLSRQFKSVIGTNIKEYINYIRIAEAEKLLAGGSNSITEAATLCGFNDSSYFASVFKRLKGITPYKYMKHHSVKNAELKNDTKI